MNSWPVGVTLEKEYANPKRNASDVIRIGGGAICASSTAGSTIEGLFSWDCRAKITIRTQLTLGDEKKFPMSSIKGGIADAILKRIRARRAGPSHTDAQDVGLPVFTAKVASVREARFSDFERVCALNLRLGQGPDSPENWKRLWRDNPAIISGKATSSIGWVLEASGEIVGFLGSIPLQYEFEGSVLRTAATCRFAVDPAYRASSHLLVVSFFRQKNVDLFLSTTAIVATGRIMTALKASPLPQPDYSTVLFWLLEPRRFSEELLKKLGVKAPFAGPGSTIASLALRADSVMRSRGPRVTSSSYAIQEINIAEIGPEFERVWRDYSREAPALFARRTPDAMRWHFDPPGNRRKVCAFAGFSGNELIGYMIIRHDGPDTEGIRRSLVADLIAKRDDHEILESLFAAAFASAKDSGCDVLEVMGFPTRIRQTFLRWKPYSRQYPACPFFYKTRDGALHEKLAKESSWYACPFDGDATLWP